MTNEQFEVLLYKLDHMAEVERRQHEVAMAAFSKAIAKLDKLIDNAPSWWIEQDQDKPYIRGVTTSLDTIEPIDDEPPF